MTNTMSHWTQTLVNISEAALVRGCGDYYATQRALARFCTEALVGACEYGYLPEADFERHDRRANAVYRLCTWANRERLRQDLAAFEAKRAAEIAAIIANLQGCM